MPSVCAQCQVSRAQIVRPKNKVRLCATCFISIFESETAETIASANLFQPGERVAIGASGGKDSTVLASVLKSLNDRHSWGLDLVLLSVDEGITGYRDHSLDAVRRNAAELDLPLHIVSYSDLYGWSMDQVVSQIGKKGNCTYCGVFRRQALDRGAAMLGVKHVVTGHNADDVAETVLMNLLRGDLARLGRATSIMTYTPAAMRDADQGTVGITDVKRSKPLMYAYEKEIVLYAHHRKLDYFSTECIYSPEAFRGSARTLIKNLERIRPESILDVVKSGIEMAKLVPKGDESNETSCKDRGEDARRPRGTRIAVDEEDDGSGGCGSGPGAGSGGQMDEMEKKLREGDVKGKKSDASEMEVKFDANEIEVKSLSVRPGKGHQGKSQSNPKVRGQKLGQCEKCGYLSSQAICKACTLLEGLNRSRPKTDIVVEVPVEI